MLTDAHRFSESIHAILIGVGTGLSSDFKPLHEVAEEVTKLYAVLTSNDACRIPERNVTRLLSPEETSHGRIISKLEEKSKDAAGGILVFYFGGHGVGLDDSFALVISGAVPGESHALLSAKDIRQALSATKARALLFIIDACGGAGIYESARDLFGSSSDGMDFRIVLASSKKGQDSWQIEGVGSLFTQHLISALQGNMKGIGKQGQIFFSDLYDHLVTSLAETLADDYPSLPLQTPVFEGSYSETDPLLFVNSDVAINQLKYQTDRYSIKFVHRRIKRVLLVIGTFIIFLSVAYWVWVDQHHYFELNKNEGIVNLYRGYPNMPIPRYYPKLITQKPLRPEQLKPDSPLINGEKVITAIQSDRLAIYKQLEPHLTPAGLISLLLDSGQTLHARRIIHNELHRSPRPQGLEWLIPLYAELLGSEQEKEDFLRSAISTDADARDVAFAFAELISLNPRTAIKALMSTKWKTEARVLGGLHRLRGVCSEEVVEFLQSDIIRLYASHLSKQGLSGGHYLAALDKALFASHQNACPPLDPPLVSPHRIAAEHIGAYTSLQNIEYRTGLLTDLKASLKSYGNYVWENPLREDTAETIAVQLANSGGGVCDLQLIDLAQTNSPITRIAIFGYLLDSCPGLTHEIKLGHDLWDISLRLFRNREYLTEVKVDLAFDYEHELYDFILDFSQKRGGFEEVNKFLITPFLDYVNALNADTATTQEERQAINSIQWAVQFRYYDPSFKRIVNDPRLSMRLNKWLVFASLRSDPQIGTELLIENLDKFGLEAWNVIEMIVLSDLPEESIARIRADVSKRGDDSLLATWLTTIFGSKIEVVSLLRSPKFGTRMSAMAVLGVRDDTAQIYAIMKESSNEFEQEILGVLQEVNAETERADKWLKETPSVALSWLVVASNRTRGMDGMALRYLRAVNVTKSEGLKRPYYGLLGLPSW